ncbi:pancreatic lipase-related protein 2 [Trichonephila clavipes]|nr:pancreatic lipase-related protein 2 [Trichonephila clavipes]
MCVCVCGFQLHNALNIEEHFYHDLLFRTELVEFLVAAVAEWHKYRIIAGLLTSSSSETLKTHRYRYPNFSEYVTNTNFSFWDIERSGFDATAQTVIVIHGFKETGIAWLKRIKDAIFKLDKCNVITVVWGQTESSYEEEKLHLPVIGNDIALFIANLVVSKNIDLQDVYLIGNSMGAHLAGFTGKAIKRKLNSLVGRITGLDPAGPDYYYADATERLAVTDAAFVDVIHTNAACTRLKAIENLDKYFACSHFRALDIFLASIENDSCEFLSYECSSWDRYLSGECDDHDVTVMGYRADMYKGLLRNSNRMKFYLKTGSVYPYCL